MIASAVPRPNDADRLYLTQLVPSLRSALDLANALALRGTDEVARAHGRDGIDVNSHLMVLATTCMRNWNHAEYQPPRAGTGSPRRRLGIDAVLLQGVAGVLFDQRVTALTATRTHDSLERAHVQMIAGVDPQVRRIAEQVISRLSRDPGAAPARS